MIVDTFAGPGGWDEGLRMIGRRDVVGLEWDAAACATAELAGHARRRADIAKTNPRELPATGLIGSPPCPGFSAAGKGLGRKDFELLLSAIDTIGIGFDAATVLDNVRAQQNDPRSALTLEPLRWALDLEPEWVALEQVPTVLPLWEAYAVILRAKGYHVWTGNLQAEQYGVPQTRRRAVLMASRDVVAAPTPTHSRYYPRTPERLDEGVRKWVSMSEALNWGMTHRPSMTVTGGGTSTGGAEPFGNAARQGMRREFEAGRWAHRRPSTTIVGSFKPEIVAAPGYRTTVSRQNAPGSVRVTVQEAGVLQSFRPDYPWQGKQGKQFQQVGNAIPPLLAAHVLAALGVGTLTQEAAA
jgi:DNA (cytosine-5)-methyltransferase 1